MKRLVAGAYKGWSDSGGVVGAHGGLAEAEQRDGPAVGLANPAATYP